MSGDKTRQESSRDKQPGTRKLFYGSIGLLLAGLVPLAIGAIYNWSLLMLVGAIGFLGAGIVQVIWLVRKVG